MPAVSEQAIASVKPASKSILKKYLELTKPERTMTNVLTAAAGFLLASGWSFRFSLLIYALLGTTLVIASACVANNLLDQKIDKQMSRTKARVLVARTVEPARAVAFAALLGVAGFGLLLLVNQLTFWLGVIAFISYVFIYGYAKRTTPWSTLVGTLPGGLSIVAGYTAAIDRLDFTALLLFLVLLTWQMGHFYAIAVYRRKDYAAARLPVWSVRYGEASTKRQIIAWIMAYSLVVLILAVSLRSWLLLILAVFGGLYWLSTSLQKSKNWASSSFSASLSVLLAFCIVVAINSLI